MINVKSPRIDDLGRVCLTDIYAEYGKLPRLAPSLFLQHFEHRPDEVVTTQGRNGTTFAAPRIAKAYREHVERLTDPSGIIPPARRRGRGRQFLSLTALAACAGPSPEPVTRQLQPFGIASLARRPSSVTPRLM